MLKLLMTKFIARVMFLTVRFLARVYKIVAISFFKLGDWLTRILEWNIDSSFETTKQ